MPRIAIVGAGIAGLTAALTLSDAGLACDLYEAAGRAGGRIRSDAATWSNGLVSDLCGEFIDADHTTIHQLIGRFGLPTIALGAGPAGHAPALMYAANRFYAADASARDLQSLGPILRRQMRDAGFPTTYAQHTEAGLSLDRLSAYEWIERHVPGGHETGGGRYLDMACTGLYGLDTTEQSALNLVYLFGSWLPEDNTETDSSPSTPHVAPHALPHATARDSATSGPMRTTTKIAGGNEQLPQAIVRALPEDAIHLAHELVALERHADDTLILTFATPAGPIQVPYDHVILTLPFSALRRVDCDRAGFDALKRTAIAELAYGTISKLFLEFDTPYWFTDGPWPRPHSGFVITDLDIQTLWDGAIGHSGPGALLVNYTSGHRGAAYAPPAAYATTDDSPTVEDYAQTCLRQVERVFPGISAHYTGRAALSFPTGDPHLGGAYACWRVGQYTRFAGYEGVRQGHIHFAGEHCSLEYQGYMEGAAQEGVRAARELLHDLD